MTTVLIVLCLLLGAALGAGAWLFSRLSRVRAEAASLGAELDAARRRADEVSGALNEAQHRERTLADRLAEQGALTAKLRERCDALDTSRKEYEQQLERRLAEQQARFKEAFDASAAATLRRTSEDFLKRADEHFDVRTKAVDELVKPISETLRKTDVRLGEMEKQRIENAARLHEQLEQSMLASRALHEETGKLARALRKPQVRGRYGETQLQRVAEIAGMRDYCDFSTQFSSRDDEGRLLRPDMIVRLPAGRVIAVDAKTNIEAYLDAIEADDEEQEARHLDRFATHVADQARKLAKKGYWAQFEASADFVIMFVPGDQFVDAALSRKPDLLESTAQQGVILASPSTLIGLLRAVAVGWRDHELSEHAKELFELGRELHERAAVAIGHAADVGKAIGTAAEKYNRFVGSVDGRLMPTLRKFEERGARSDKTIADATPLSVTTRSIQSLPATTSDADTPVLPDGA